MSRTIASDQDHGGIARVLNLPTPGSPAEPATKAYVDSVVEGLAAKDNVRVRSVANLNLASPGASVDGVAMALGDRFFADGQTTATQKGLYNWNGAAVTATRTPDASTADELENAVFSVDEGTSAGTTWRQTTVNFVIEVGTPVFVSFGTVAPAASETTAGIAEIATQAETDAGTDDVRYVTPAKLKQTALILRKVVFTFGDGTATSYVLTHSLNTRDVVVDVVRVAAPYDTVILDVERTSTTTITLRAAAAIALNSLRAVIVG